MDVSKQTSQITRAQARARGLTTYFTGKPCSYGHVVQQWTRNGECVECGRIRSRSNTKRWRVEFAEQDPAGYRVYRAEEARKRRAKYPEKIKAIDQRSRAKRRAYIQAYMKRWRAENREHLRVYDSAQKKQWRKDNPEKASIKGRRADQRRYARELGAEGTFTVDDIERMMVEQDGQCANPHCRAGITELFEIDHKISLINGGTHWPDNLHLLCQPCNRRKNHRNWEEWLALL